MMRGFSNAPLYVQKAVNRVIKEEGGYANHPNDSGGETMFGITWATARRNGYEGRMVDLPLSVAKDIYTKEYFYSPNFNLILDHSPIIAEELFEAGVLSGPRLPATWLQKLLNIMNDNQRYYGDISEDGAIGPITVGTLEKYLLLRGSVGEDVLYNLLNCMQANHFIELASRKVSQETFLYGWAKNRLRFIQ